MKRTALIGSLWILLGLTAALPVRADGTGGFWLPTQIEGRLHQALKRQGLRLDAREIYDINRACLSNAILSLSVDEGTFSPFASASFISDEGLVLTNFHCVASYLEQISDAGHDYVKYGCWATSRDEETYLPNLQVNQLIAVRDVTDSILVHTAGLRGADFTRRINENSSRLIKREVRGRGITGKVYSLFGGQQYILTLYRSFRDVRIVAAPPISIGKFGGDTDNWQWPRYSADFAILRVYADAENRPAPHNTANRPYRPESHLTISSRGVRENDFVMVAGYPAQTRQYIPSFALERIVFNETRAEADLARIKLDYYTRCKELCADSLYSSYNVLAGSAANVYLRSRGEISGVRAAGLVEKRRRREAALAAWIAADSARQQRYGSNLLPDMEANYARLTPLNYADLMFRSTALYGARIIPFAGKFERLVQMENRRRKPSAEALNGEINRLRPLAGAFYRDFRIEDDKYLMEKILGYYIEHVDTALFSPSLRIAATRYPHHFHAYIDSLYAHSPLRDRESALRFLDRVPDHGVADLRDDGLYRLALDFYLTYVRQINPQRQIYQTKNQELYARYLQAYAEKNRGTTYPYDANRTPRYSFGRVRAAAPGEGVIYTPFTTLQGMIDRHQLYAGERDFALPAGFLRLIGQQGSAVPACCFLTDAQTTSGSSGSAVLNGKGEVVGINFDRIWQGLSSDYEPDNGRSRNIVVDIRYMLWVLEHYSPSHYILQELEID